MWWCEDKLERKTTHFRFPLANVRSPEKTTQKNPEYWFHVGTTVVKFAPGAFSDPYSYIGMEETMIGVQILDSYMLGKIPDYYSRLKRGVRDTVIATWKAENLWLRKKTELTQYLAWRYIGTSNGVFRKTPGSVIPNKYDPRDRPW